MMTRRKMPLKALVVFVGLTMLITVERFGIRANEPQGGAKMVEGRAVWMHPESQFSPEPEKGRQEVRQFVERIANANFNLILPWVRSEYVAALTDEDYQKGVPIAKWDALGELIKAAHEKGLAVHLWYSFTYYKSAGCPDFNPKHGGNPAWAARRIDELVPDKTTGLVHQRWLLVAGRQADWEGLGALGKAWLA